MTVLPILDYGDIIYRTASETALKKLDTLHHAAIRFATNAPFHTHHYTNMWRLSLLCMAVLSRSLSSALQPDDHVAREGRAELQKLRGFAAQPRYGECWSRALEKIQMSCQQFTDETQSKIALAFTHCHLRRSGRPFPDCTDDSEVRSCTQHMDPVAFNTYTEFFTHAHSICHYLQSERWQHRAENTIHRLTESSAGVAEQLASTRRVAEDLVEAQSAALKTQEVIVRNGEQLKLTLQDSTQGVKASFIMSESHTLSSLLYNALGLCAAFLLTSTQRTAGARLLLFGLVAVNVYLERMICRTVLESTDPGYLQMERINLLVGLLRWAMVLLGLLVLVYCAARFRDLRLESLEILAQLKETQSSLHMALQRAESLTEAVDGTVAMKRGLGSVKADRWRRKKESWAVGMDVQELSVILAPSFSPDTLPVSEEPSVSDSQEAPLGESAMVQTQSALAVPCRRGRPRSSGPHHRPSSALVYSVLVENNQSLLQPRYNLRNRTSLSGSVTELREAP
ncbi:hypothetical protein AAFF_G00059570 [Aldrovandia affinis]|uniref:Uncharacterized protein n=1 Tax=Aldrovandia affinis TaxID=143900 RepID=A0AAD7S018_9TELE|nr:hypothetical protein AAFF_G00059570 [Aldrovandia affinis]